MTKKRYKKLLMSTGIQRNLAEQLTVWGRHENIQIDRRTMHLDAFRIGFLYDVRLFTKTLYGLGVLISDMVMDTATNVLDASNAELYKIFEGGDLDV